MAEIGWHRRETRRQTENTNFSLSGGKDSAYSPVQPHLSLEDVRRIWVALVPTEAQSAIEALVKASADLRNASRNAYEQAQQALESEIGLTDFSNSGNSGYIGSFRELASSRRFDPEHYYPAFARFRESLPSSVSLEPLARHLNFCQRGKQPAYCRIGHRVINSKHVQPNRVLIDDNRTAKPNPDCNLQINRGDTLLNGTGRGTLGRAAPYLFDEPAIPDNHVTILRSDTLDPVYLSLYLNSAAGQMQTEMHQRGTSGQLELYPFDIRKFLVWDAPQSFQQELRRLHDQAAAAELEAKRLLEEAKSRVEQLIEEAAAGS